METNIFDRKRPDFSELAEYGFVKTGSIYHYETDFMDGDFRAVIEIDPVGNVRGTVIDKMNNEEYMPLKSSVQNGAYVNSVRNAYEEVLMGIAEKCCVDVLFASDQANRVAELIFEKYGDIPDFPWEEKPHRTSGVFRHPDTAKWYGLIMRVKKTVLDKAAEDVQVNAMNLKIRECDGDELRKEEGIYQGYHMNHRLWISVLLDDTLRDERIMELVEESYQLTDRKRKKG